MKLNTPPQPRSVSWDGLYAWLQFVIENLNIRMTSKELESIMAGVFTSMSGPLRKFHTMEHIFKFKPRSALETLAVMYHDIVYWNVDGNYPPVFKKELETISKQAIAGEKLASSSLLPYYSEALMVFGLETSFIVPKPGANELFSALAFLTVWGKKLDRKQAITVLACIETTIPFRGISAKKALSERLLKLGLSKVDAEEILFMATHMGNSDVMDFAAYDLGIFLGGTWNLLPELNEDLHISSYYSISEYRSALLGMEKFFGYLTPEMLFDTWGEEPSKETLKDIREKSAYNLRHARQYLWAKLFASALLEAFALVSGGEAPLSMFMGSTTAQSKFRLEGLLPELPPYTSHDIIYKLLAHGRSSQASFDLSNSPLAAWLYQQMSDEDRNQRKKDCEAFFDKKMNAEKLLKNFSKELVLGLGKALEQFVPTRSEAIKKFLEGL